MSREKKGSISDRNNMLELIQLGTDCGILVIRAHSGNGFRNAIVEYANENFMKMNHLGDGNIVGTDFLSGPGQVIPGDELMRLNRELENAIKEDRKLLRMNLRIQPEGKTLLIQITCRVIPEEDSMLIQIVETDRTELHQLQNEIKVKNQRLRLAEQLIEKYAGRSFHRDGICIWEYYLSDRSMVVKLGGGSGFQRDAVIQNVPESIVEQKLVHPDQKEDYLRLYSDIAAGKQKTEGRFLIKGTGRKDADHGCVCGNVEESYHWSRISYHTIFDEDGTPIGAVGMTEEAAEENLFSADTVDRQGAAEAQRDRLTDFYVGKTFDTLAERKVLQQDKNALILINMDNFRYVSDDFGNGFADSVLQAQTMRIQAVFTEEEKIILGRVGKDEFAVLISDYESREAIIYQTDSLLRSLHVCFEYEGRSFESSCSIGVAFANSEETYGDMMRHSRSALSLAKNAGKDTYRIYEEEMN